MPTHAPVLIPEPDDDDELEAAASGGLVLVIMAALAMLVEGDCVCCKVGDEAFTRDVFSA